MDYSLPVSFVYEIFQARIPNGLPFPSPRDLPDPVDEPRFPALQADSLPLSHQGSPQQTTTGTNNLPNAITLEALVARKALCIEAG